MDSKALTECFNDSKNVYSNVTGFNPENDLEQWFCLMVWPHISLITRKNDIIFY